MLLFALKETLNNCKMLEVTLFTIIIDLNDLGWLLETPCDLLGTMKYPI